MSRNLPFHSQPDDVPLADGVIHPLPPARAFTGGEKALASLRRELFESPQTRVVSLIGIGGAGKTAIAAKLLSEILSPQPSSRFDGVLVWNFYVDQDTG